VVIRVATKFKEQHAADAMIAVPRMRFRDRLPPTMGSFLAAKSIVFDVINDLQQEKRQASDYKINGQKRGAKKVSKQAQPSGLDQQKPDHLVAVTPDTKPMLV
jgi:hypothetical protein